MLMIKVFVVICFEFCWGEDKERVGDLALGLSRLRAKSPTPYSFLLKNFNLLSALFIF